MSGKILVTGGAGFIGSWMVDLLDLRSVGVARHRDVLCGGEFLPNQFPVSSQEMI